MAESIPLTDQESIQQHLLMMGFEPNHIHEAIRLFEQNHGDDYNVSVIVDLTIQIKSKETEMKERVSHHNMQTMGNQLYYKIQSMEPILAGKITGMMLQWDTDILRTLLDNKHELQRLINKAKSALDELPFKPHMSLSQAHNLQPNDKIDFRNIFGKFVHSNVSQKDGNKLRIESASDYFNVDVSALTIANGVGTWCDATKELHRFAVSGSISARPAHRFCHLSIGDMVDFKPNRDMGWTCGKVIRLDSNSGQIEVMYDYFHTPHLSTRTAWTHVDNEDEISVFRTKYEYVDISTNLLNWNALSPNPFSQNRTQEVEQLLLLNDNEIMMVMRQSSGIVNIVKYCIRSNKWRYWMSTPHYVCCCLNKDKTKLYILSKSFRTHTDTPNSIRNRDIYVCITELAISSFITSGIPYFATFPCVPECMVMVEDTLQFHFFGHKYGTGLHVVWDKKMRHALVSYAFDASPVPILNREGMNHALVHCPQRNILLLFGGLFGDTIYVHSLKSNQWYLRSLMSDRLRNPFSDLFGFEMTNDERYILIFPGNLSYRSRHLSFGQNQIGNIYLIDIENTRLICSKTKNVLLGNLQNSSAHNIVQNVCFSESRMFWPLIVNKTTMLMDGFLRECWQSNEFRTVRLLSEDVVSMIKTMFGFDNDELYIYCVDGGYLWNTKVNEIIKHQLPKLKFCCDSRKLTQEQKQLVVLKNELWREHNNLIARSRSQLTQDLTFLTQYMHLSLNLDNQ